MALFTEYRFSASDRGGNAIPIEGQGSVRNLHVLWDSVIGRSVSDWIQQRRAARIMRNHPSPRESALNTTDIAIWVREGVTLSRTLADDSDVLDQVQRFDRTRVRKSY